MENGSSLINLVKVFKMGCEEPTSSFSCGSFSPVSFCTDCSPPPPIILLDEFEFAKIIEWEDVIIHTIPSLPVLGKHTPTSQEECGIKAPTTINIICRLTADEKIFIRNYYREHKYHCLSENYVPIAYVWIEQLVFTNACSEDKDRPWLTRLRLICRNI